MDSTGAIFITTTDTNGQYSLSLAAETYDITCSAAGYEDVTTAVKIKNKDLIQDFTLNPITTITISSLTATPSSFTEADVATVSLDSTIDEIPTGYTWTDISY